VTLGNDGWVWRAVSATAASRLLRFEALALLKPVALDKFFIGSHRLLGFRQATAAAVGLTQLVVSGVTIRVELSGRFKTFDSASRISLL